MRVSPFLTRLKEAPAARLRNDFAMAEHLASIFGASTLILDLFSPYSPVTFCPRLAAGPKTSVFFRY